MSCTLRGIHGRAFKKTLFLPAFSVFKTVHFYLGYNTISISLVNIQRLSSDHILWNFNLSIIPNSSFAWYLLRCKPFPNMCNKVHDPH